MTVVSASKAQTAESIIKLNKQIDSLENFTKNKEELAIAYNKLALIYTTIGEYSKSINTHLRIIKNCNNSPFYYCSVAKYNIAVNFQRCNQFKEALKYAFNALNEFKSVKNIGLKKEDLQIKIADCTNLIGAIYSNYPSPYSNALLYLEKSDSVFRLLKRYDLLANTLVNKGFIYIGTEKYDQAFFLFKQAKHYFLLSNDSNGVSTSYINLSAANFNIYEFQKENTVHLRKSINYLDSADFFLPKLADSENLLNIRLYKSMLYEALKIHDSAFYFHKSYITLKDSIYNLEKAKEIENLKINFDLDKKVLYNKMLLAENKNLSETNQKRKLLILIIIMFLIISVLGFTYWSFRNKAQFEKKEREYNEKMLIKQMDPHFVFNAINSAQEYVLVNESDKAQNYLSKISQLIRLFLNYHSKSEILISEDLKVLKLYVEVESQRLNKPIKLTVVNNTEYDLDEIIIPPALIQPLIENAVWHGFRNTSNNELELTFEVKDTLLHIRISDNGKGFLSHEFQASSKGLNLLKERLALLNNRKSDCLVYGNNSSGGAYVEFFFPLKLRF